MLLLSLFCGEAVYPHGKASGQEESPQQKLSLRLLACRGVAQVASEAIQCDTYSKLTLLTTQSSCLKEASLRSHC